MSRSVKIFLCCLALAVAAFVILAVSGKLDFLTYRRNHIDQQLVLQRLWEANDFFELVDLTEENLKDEPLHPNYLLYNGLSHYYVASSGVDREETQYHIENSIRSLRKLLLLPQPPQLNSIYLTLGKSYYRKGQLYYPQAIEYLERALPLQGENDEAYQYLGAAYAHLNQYDKSIEYLSHAAERSSSLPLKFALAEIYVISGQAGGAEEIYRELQGGALNGRDSQQLQLLEIKILIARQEYARAQEKLTQLVDEYPNIADAYFYLGEVHSHLQEPDKARYNWREALKIDPNHARALRQLQQ